MKLRKVGNTNDVALTCLQFTIQPAGWVIGLTLGTEVGQGQVVQGP